MVIEVDELEIDDFYNVHKYSQQKVKLCDYVKVWIMIVNANIIFEAFQVIKKMKSNRKNTSYSVLKVFLNPY